MSTSSIPAAGLAPRSGLKDPEASSSGLASSERSDAPRQQKGWRPIAYLGIFVGTMIASVPLAEIAFRLLGDEPSLDLRGMYAPFDDGSYKLASNVNTDARLASGRLVVCTDALGFRCDADRRFASYPGASIDVLLIGDSQGFGKGVNFEESIAGAFAGAADKQGYRVANASVGGHSFASQLLLSQRLVEKHHLKIRNFVVLLTPAMIHSSASVNRAIVGKDGRLYGALNVKTRVRSWIKSHLVIYSRVRDAVRNLGIGVNPSKGSALVFDFYKTEGEKAVQETFFNTLVKVKDFSDQLGASISLVYVPLTIEADFATVQHAAAKHNLTLDPEKSFRVVSLAAQRLNLPLHDLRPVLERVYFDKQVLNVKADFHYSPVLSRNCGLALWGELKPRLASANIRTANTNP
jgi:hypothetical protein